MLDYFLVYNNQSKDLKDLEYIDQYHKNISDIVSAHIDLCFERQAIFVCHW